jgi:hypothetical protein
VIRNGNPLTWNTLSSQSKLTFTCKGDAADSSVASAPQQAGYTSFLFPLIHAPGPQSIQKKHSVLIRTDVMLMLFKAVWYTYSLLQMGVLLTKLFTPVKNILNFMAQILNCKMGFTFYPILPDPIN